MLTLIDIITLTEGTECSQNSDKIDSFLCNATLPREYNLESKWVHHTDTLAFIFIELLLIITKLTNQPKWLLIDKLENKMLYM